MKKKTIGLFLPCYINQFYPQIGIKTLQIIESLNYIIDFPLSQTCCGQPISNAGYDHCNQKIYDKFFEEFNKFDLIVSPSASCVYHLKKQWKSKKKKLNFTNKIYELTDFLIKIEKIKKLKNNRCSFKRIGIHYGCHALRGLNQSNSSEIVSAKPFSNIIYLLNLLKNVKYFLPERKDECCGFGGFFSIEEPEVSYSMGKTRISEHQKNQVEVICSNDTSCLIHLDGIIKRKKLAIETKHIVELIA